MKEVTARIEMVAGQRFDGTAFTKVAYDPYERSVIFTETTNEIRLDPHSNASTAASPTTKP